MADRKLFNFMAHPDQIETWKEEAHLQRKSLAQWVRETLDRAIGVFPPAPIQAAPSVRVEQQRSNVNALAQELVQKATSKKNGKCENRVPKGAFCKSCGNTH